MPSVVSSEATSPAQMSPASPKRRNSRARVAMLAWIVALVAPTALVLSFTVAPSADALWAALRWSMAKPSIPEEASAAELVTARRTIQRQFLDHGVYIPFEDITFDVKGTDASEPLLFLMRKSCGMGRIYIWIPLKLRLPILGEKVFEWCLTHQ